MSITGYFGRVGPVRLIRRERSDGLGITAEGPVLQGEKTPEEARAAEAARTGGEDREFYVRPGDYDPVLRSHCGF